MSKRRTVPLSRSGRSVGVVTSKELRAIEEDLKTDRRMVGTILQVGNLCIAVKPGFQRSSRVFTGDLELALPEVLHELPKPECRETYTVDLNHRLRDARVVVTTPDQGCFWAQSLDSDNRVRLDWEGKPLYRRFVCGTFAQTSVLTFILERQVDQIAVVTAYYGLPSRPQPGIGRVARKDALWWYNPLTMRGHAYVVDRREGEDARILWSTQTDDCPW